jgi:hypothetical protein
MAMGAGSAWGGREPQHAPARRVGLGRDPEPSQHHVTGGAGRDQGTDQLFLGKVLGNPSPGPLEVIVTHLNVKDLGQEADLAEHPGGHIRQRPLGFDRTAEFPQQNLLEFGVVMRSARRIDQRDQNVGEQCLAWIRTH